MTFEEYLVKKRINKAAFEAEDSVRYTAWEEMYAQMHPNSFYMAVKMVLNDVRLRYHLREEDVPKVEAPVVPRPAARRAVAPAAGAAEVVKPEVPALAVPQETSEENLLAPAATPKPRPVIRRPAAMQKPPIADESTAPQEGKIVEEQTASPAAARPRPVIKRPVAAEPTVNAAAEKPAESEKPAARPRPVIKRPAALQKPTQETETPASQAPPIEEQGTGPDQVVTTPETAPMPPRPRPIIRRPAAPTSETENADTLRKEMQEKPVVPEQETKPVPPRPRPIIKRPTPPTESGSAEAQQPDSSNAEQVAQPENTEQAPEQEKPKPPRPRPIIRRPSPKPDAESDNEQAGPV
jgi:hypothetical protein